MKQPVSRNSFDRLRGYLGVYLQEGAPFVDACWNEGSDIHASLLRDAVRDAGLDGTAGIELRVDPVLAAGGSLQNLLLRGGPGRFYCGGLPVLWPESRLIDAQRVDQDPLAPSQPWLSSLKHGVAHTIYLQAWLETEDALDRPDLDDPGIGAERGSFRARVCSRVSVGTQMPPVAETNLRLTVQGAYTSDLNVLYRVELVDLIRRKGEPVASILWDSAGASVVAKVTDRAEATARKVLLSRTDGFEVGSCVRFEGPEVDPTIYEIVDRDSTSITVQGSLVVNPPLSMAHFHGHSVTESGDRLVVVLFDDLGVNGPSATIPKGSRVHALPPDLAASRPAATWLVTNVAIEGASGCTTFTLAPNGLVAPLDPWSEAFASKLVLAAHSFDVCLEVDARPEWAEGMRVRIFADLEREPRPMLEFIDTESGHACLPGEENASFYEDRTIARIIRHGTPGNPSATMTLRLDQPLTYDHACHDRVVPERLIKARRYSGHACVPIDTLDPSVTPGREELYGPYSLEGGFALPSGLALRLSVETAPGAQAEPVLLAGDGWTFAARAGGWVQSRVFAPVERIPWGQAPLATLTLHENGFDLIDVRPVPAPHAQHGWLEAIRTAAEEIAVALEDHPGSTAGRIAEVARHPRVQVNLVPLIDVLVVGLPPWLTDDPRCQRALTALAEATHAVSTHEDLLADAELSRVAVAMERLSFAVALAKQCARSDDRIRPPEPEPRREAEDGRKPWPVEETSPLSPEEKALEVLHFLGDASAPPVAEPLPEAVEQPVEVAPGPPEADVEAVEAAPGPPEVEVQPVEVAPGPPEADVEAVGAVFESAEPPLDPATLPVRLLRQSRGSGTPRRNWITLGDVPAPAAVSRERERRVAETVAMLLDQTAAIGAKAVSRPGDRAAHQEALDELWKARFHLEQLPRTLTVDDAIAFCTSRSRPPREES